MTEVQPIKLFMMYVPPQHEQYYRPYITNLNGDTLGRVVEDTDNGKIFNAKTLLKSASDLIMPSLVIGEQVDIPNGLTSGRHAFYLEVEVTGIYGTRSEIYGGFTETSFGVSSTGNVDPEMLFYINSFTLLGGNGSIGARGTVPISHMGSYQVLTGAGDSNRNNLVTMRTEDISNAGQAQNIMQGGENVYDLRNSLRHESLLSKRDNTQPANYLSTLCSGYVNAAVSSGGVYGMGAENEYYHEVTANMRTPQLSEGRFISSIGAMGEGATSTFTLNDLLSKWTLPTDFLVVATGDRSGVLSDPLQYSSHWRGADNITRIGFTLKNILPPIMTNFMLLSAKVIISNVSGTPVVYLTEPVPMFKNSFDQQKATAFENEVLHAVVFGMLDGLVNTYNLSLNLRLMSSSLYDISVDGQHSVPYVAPLFCDGRISPVVTDDRQNVTNINETVELLVSHISEPVRDCLPVDRSYYIDNKKTETLNVSNNRGITEMPTLPKRV